MADIWSSTMQSWKDKKGKSATISDSSQNQLNKSPSLKRKSRSSSDSGDQSKKPKTGASKVSNVHVDTSPSRTEWTLKEEEELVDKVQHYLMSKEDADEAKKPIYLKRIEWSKIDCGNHTRDEARFRLLAMSKRVRKKRSASEILQDVKEIYIKKAKKKQEKKDLSKLPLLPYFRFAVAKRHGIAKRHPELKSTDVTRKLGSKWKKLSEEKKKKYYDGYHEEMKSYVRQVIEYLKTRNPEISPPRNKFEVWAEQEEKKIRADSPDISEEKLAKKLKRRWEDLDEEDRAKWEEMEKRELKYFRRRIVLLRNENSQEPTKTQETQGQESKQEQKPKNSLEGN